MAGRGGGGLRVEWGQGQKKRQRRPHGKGWPWSDDGRNPLESLSHTSTHHREDLTIYLTTIREGVGGLPAAVLSSNTKFVSLPNPFASSLAAVQEPI